MPAETSTTAVADEVLVRHESRTAVITINRPHAKNAVTRAVAEGIAAALDELDRRDDLSVGVLTGAGGSFCAGMDLKGFLRGERPTIEGRGFAGLTEAPPKKPLIAAVEGYALAGGCEIVLACDLVVAGRTAKFGIPEVKRGLVATGGGLLRLPHRVPEQIAMELALTGDMITAARAYEVGLVNRLTDEGGALAEALALAGRIAANGPLAVLASKQVIKEHGQWPETERFARQRRITEPVFASADAQEGARAFAEKRLPNWQGR
ncbi:crotonase/enoyl-CoA hydratase family protein [Actinomadura rudentiformis]|uniref:Crotonase/enoyl-CoA hydratase family protein n=1 Tax=Actinomadura rudentiformis TaxID=359158 RepID=A0A6H9YV23_9ACTN|nr:crotonase/enoyl-CoA hydratase family protein [Actinomadura rudentiformis]KAB2344470.1 crotonase/enoyl-CoA hydratase family protein [Actinomadura rudentiformis]